MPKLVDCFLYNDEVELLEIRLRLLDSVVDHFVIVWAAETFTGKRKDHGFPSHLAVLRELADRVRVIQIEQLHGTTAWQKEWFSRDALAQGFHGLAEDDLVMISDVDEVPRPDVLRAIRTNAARAPKVLVQDYFNFKFNYQLVVGLQAAWAGPVVCPRARVSTPQALRDIRWSAMQDQDMAVHDGGWHFSFLTASDDVQPKLASFSHQEAEVQSRRERVPDLIAARLGFHDHMHPGAVWAVVDKSSYRCAELAKLVDDYPRFMLPEPPDDPIAVATRVKSVVNRIDREERHKMLRRCTTRELAAELWRRARSRAKSDVKGGI